MRSKQIGPKSNGARGATPEHAPTMPPEMQRALALAALVEAERAATIALPRMRLAVASTEFGELELALLPEPIAITLGECVGSMSDEALMLFMRLGEACQCEQRVRQARTGRKIIASKTRRVDEHT